MRRSSAGSEKQACTSKSNATNPVQKHVRLLAITGEILAEEPTAEKAFWTVFTAKLGVRTMSALGQKQTSAHVRVMSALPPIADMVQHDGDVRFVPKADILAAVRYD
jgi:hypothetical protein